jgi:hypothetical protein
MLLITILFVFCFYFRKNPNLFDPLVREFSSTRTRLEWLAIFLVYVVICYLIRTVLFARFVSVACGAWIYVWVGGEGIFGVSGYAWELAEHRVMEEGSVAGCVCGRASGRSSARDYAVRKGRGNFESAAAAVVGGPVYCGDGDVDVRKMG